MADKPRGGEGHQPLVYGFAVVSGPEGDLAISQAHQALVGDGHPVGIAAEVMIDVKGDLKRAFGVDHPLFSGKFPGETPELHRVCQSLQLAFCVSLLEALQKLAPDDLGEGPDRQQEAVASGDPSVARGAHAAAGDHQMQVRM